MADDRYLRGFGSGKFDAFHGILRTRSEISCGAEFYRAYVAGHDRGVVLAATNPVQGSKWVHVQMEDLHLYVG